MFYVQCFNYLCAHDILYIINKCKKHKREISYFVTDPQRLWCCSLILNQMEIFCAPAETRGRRVSYKFHLYIKEVGNDFIKTRCKNWMFVFFYDFAMLLPSLHFYAKLSHIWLLPFEQKIRFKEVEGWTHSSLYVMDKEWWGTPREEWSGQQKRVKRSIYEQHISVSREASACAACNTFPLLCVHAIWIFLTVLLMRVHNDLPLK